MLVLTTEQTLEPEIKEKLRQEVMARTGEDCLILDCGLQLTQILLEKDSATGGNQ